MNKRRFIGVWGVSLLLSAGIAVLAIRASNDPAAAPAPLSLQAQIQETSPLECETSLQVASAITYASDSGGSDTPEAAVSIFLRQWYPELERADRQMLEVPAAIAEGLGADPVTSVATEVSLPERLVATLLTEAMPSGGYSVSTWRMCPEDHERYANAAEPPSEEDAPDDTPAEPSDEVEGDQ